MQAVSAVSSNRYVSFMIVLEDDIIGCHLPRNDASEFAKGLANLLQEKDEGESMSEMDYETDSMHIEVMSSLDAVMYLFKNKTTDTTMQLAINEAMSKSLASCLGNVENSSSKIHGPIPEGSGPWKFFEIKKAS